MTVAEQMQKENKKLGGTGKLQTLATWSLPHVPATSPCPRPHDMAQPCKLPSYLSTSFLHLLQICFP